MQRYASVIGVKPEGIEEYERLHANTWPEVLATIYAANIRNYSIYRFENTLFAYFEYVGDDYAADMTALAADEETRRWWSLTDAMQEPHPDRPAGAWWLDLPEIFHTD